ncbi:type 1 glutamine amidotransferase [Spongisporangium articulatum]|uniref:Type 1 glutamine amidotransferase n=1 Tax=Spongisporangium articulatum TaxID=3362603 RepID=A0ABW8ALT5_9ACTN
MTRPLLVVEHEADASLDLMDPPLRAASPVVVVRPYLGEALPGVADLTAFAGLVVLGGEMAAWEDERAPWLPATRALLAQAVRTQLPTLGICLGAQLLAHATGGRAMRGDDGLEVGAVPLRVLPGADGDPVVPAADFTSLTYHRDVVGRLPADAELLVTGDRYPVQAFRVGARAWGVQYHPEVSVRAFEHWMDTSATLADEVGARGGDVAQLRAEVGAADGVQAELATAHAMGVAQVAGRPQESV